MKDIKNFDYSPQLYDLQVDWQSRLARERPLFEKIIIERKVKKILDIGCGTGHHVQLFAEILESSALNSISINEQDITVIGADPSQETVKFAEQEVVKSKAARLLVGGFENIEKLAEGQFDLITCLGNTLALLGSRRKVKAALKTTRHMLVKGGAALFQFLNFEPKIIQKERYYRPKSFSKDKFRYLTLKHFQHGKLKTLADFIKIQMDKSGNVTDFDYSTSSMCTLRKNLFLKIAKNAGFKKIELLSPDGREEFDKNRHISLNAVLYN